MKKFLEENTVLILIIILLTAMFVLITSFITQKLVKNYWQKKETQTIRQMDEQFNKQKQELEQMREALK